MPWRRGAELTAAGGPVGGTGKPGGMGAPVGGGGTGRMENEGGSLGLGRWPEGEECLAAVDGGPHGGPPDGGTDPETGAGFTGFPQNAGMVEMAGDPAFAPVWCEVQNKGWAVGSVALTGTVVCAPGGWTCNGLNKK